MQKKPDEPIALIDMDGTLCDYWGAMRRDLASLRSPEEAADDESDPPWLKARRELIKAQPGWWDGLQPLTQNFAVVEVMRELHFDLHVLTKGPWRHATAWAEKVQWCRRNLPDASIHITEDKGLVYGKVLMDDYPLYIRRWLEWRPRGLVIMPAWPWNEGAFTDNPNVLRYDGSNLEAVREALGGVRATAG